MGVHGLWRLIEPSGKPVPLETLENKVLAVDISIWLHQAIKGFQDSKGAPLPNAHLLGIYHRVCKLLYFKIKPVFVFDGGVPVLKKQTIAKRNQAKTRNQTDAERIQKQLINTLLKHTAITNVLSEKTKATISPSPPKKSPGKSKADTIDELFALPATYLDSTVSSSSDDEEVDGAEGTDLRPSRHLNIHNIDTESKEFKALPADVRYDILSEVKETRKQSSWGRIHEMPTYSDGFSSYQMERLLQRQTVQSELEKTEKEMGGHSLSLGELESLMKDQGVITKNDQLGRRIASDENTRYLLIKDIKQAIEEALKEERAKKKASEEMDQSDEEIVDDMVEEKNKAKETDGVCETDQEAKDSHRGTGVRVESGTKDTCIKSKADVEYEEDLRRAIILSHLEGVTKDVEDKTVVEEVLEDYQHTTYKDKLKEAIILSSIIKTDNKEDYVNGSSKRGETSRKTVDIEEQEDEDLQKAIQLSLECVSAKPDNGTTHSVSQASYSGGLSLSTIEEHSDLSENEEGDNESEIIKKMSSAQSYMLEYSGLTPFEIAKIIKQTATTNKSKDKLSKETIKKTTKHVATRNNEENKKNLINEVSSCTSDYHGLVNKEKCLPNNQETTKDTENVDSTTVEIMSDSDESSDFIDVTEEENRMEIIIKPDAEIVEDDLFSDIFNDEVGNTAEQERTAVDTKGTKDKGICITGDSEVSNSEEVNSKKDDFEASNINIPEENGSDKSEENNSKHDESETNKFSVAEDMEVSKSEIDSVEDGLESNISSSDEVLKRHDYKTILPSMKEKLKALSQKPLVTDKTTILELSVQEKNDQTKNVIDDVEMQMAHLHSESIIEESRTVDSSSSVSSSKDIVVEAIDLEKKEFKDTTGNQEGSIQQSEPEISRLSVEEMKELKEGLRRQQFQLQTEKSIKERLAGNITDQMYEDAQELLQLFGVPYIVAPMEAEAQCAFLDEIDLTDGTITDDSDIWLFGGQTVYKNFFNQSKHVMEFRAENILHHFKLTRQQMILLALLVGSDYTTGIQGVGPVTALEILAAFPPASSAEFSLKHSQLLSGLTDFRNWFSKGKTPGLGQNTLRSKLKNVKFTENFPSIQVVQAYLDPKVETSREKFSWGKPDIVGLIDFARYKFGWTTKKSEEILSPVIKRLEERHSQKTIRDYFKTKTRIISDEPKSKMSKRVKTALKRIGNEPLDDSDEEETKPKPKRSRKKKKEDPSEVTDINGDTELPNLEGNSSKSRDDELIINESNTETIKPKRNRAKKKKGENLEGLAEDEDVKILQATVAHSSKRVRQINDEITSEIAKAEVKKAKAPNLHKKEMIPQREKDKTELLKKKLKAIEIFRKSQKGPGFTKKRQKKTRAPKEDAGLSESSSEDN